MSVFSLFSAQIIATTWSSVRKRLLLPVRIFSSCLFFSLLLSASLLFSSHFFLVATPSRSGSKAKDLKITKGNSSSGITPREPIANSASALPISESATSFLGILSMEDESENADRCAIVRTPSGDRRFLIPFWKSGKEIFAHISDVLSEFGNLSFTKVTSLTKMNIPLCVFHKKRKKIYRFRFLLRLRVRRSLKT